MTRGSSPRVRTVSRSILRNGGLVIRQYFARQEEGIFCSSPSPSLRSPLFYTLFHTPTVLSPFFLFLPRKIMLHVPIDQRRHHHVNRQNFLSHLLFSVESTDTTQATATSIVDSPIAITVSVTSTVSSSTSVTQPCSSLCFPRMLPTNKIPFSHYFVHSLPDVFCFIVLFNFFDHLQYFVRHFDDVYYNTSEPYLDYFIPRLVNIFFSLPYRLPQHLPSPLFAPYPVSQHSVERLPLILAQLTPLSVERVAASLLVVFSLLSSAQRVFCSRSFTFWLVSYSFLCTTISYYIIRGGLAETRMKHWLKKSGLALMPVDSPPSFRMSLVLSDLTTPRVLAPDLQP